MDYSLIIATAPITELIDHIDEESFYLNGKIKSVIDCINNILYYCEEFEKKIEKEEDITEETIADFISDIRDTADDASNLLE